MLLTGADRLAPRLYLLTELSSWIDSEVRRRHQSSVLSQCNQVRILHHVSDFASKVLIYWNSEFNKDSVFMVFPIAFCVHRSCIRTVYVCVTIYRNCIDQWLSWSIWSGFDDRFNCRRMVQDLCTLAYCVFEKGWLCIFWESYIGIF